MVVLDGISTAGTGPEARPDWTRLEMGRVEAGCGDVGTARHGDGLGEVWYYISSADRYSRRIEGGAPAGARVNHIVLWARSAADAAGAPPPTGCELGCRAGEDGVSIAYSPGADPAMATISLGSASIVFDPRTIADVIVWTQEARIGGRHQGRFIWHPQARGGAGAFVFARYVDVGNPRDIRRHRDGGIG